MFTQMIDMAGEWNAQFFREAKGRLKLRSIIVVGTLSILGQMFIYLLYSSQLPGEYSRYGRYCINKCQLIDWELWHLDMFVCMSIISIFSLLVAGVYLLIADLSHEEKKGTLGFIRLSPQSALEIFLGKMLGVPILLYLTVLLSVPLQLINGLSAGIPVTLIFGFYLVLGMSCFFFYSLSLLFGLLSYNSQGFSPWVGSGVTAFYCIIYNAITFSNYGHRSNPLDWIKLFYPGTILPYLVNATRVLPYKRDYLPIKQLNDLNWYELYLWQNPAVGMAISLLFMGLVSFWIWHGLKRRYHNPNITLMSKNQSYWISTITMAIILGFAIDTSPRNDYVLDTNLATVVFFHLVLLISLIFALTNHRNTLQDWSRYRHQQQNRSLVRDLLFGEKSPSILAIAVNSLISIVVMLPGILLTFRELRWVGVVSLLVQTGMIVIYALVIQLILLRRNKRRETWARGIMAMMLSIPPIALGLLGLYLSNHPFFWLFMPLPLFAVQEAGFISVFFSIIVQWTAIALGSSLLTKQLRKIGESEMKALLGS